MDENLQTLESEEILDQIYLVLMAHGSGDIDDKECIGELNRIYTENFNPTI